MQRAVIRFGLWSGAVLAGLMALSMVLESKGIIDFDNAEIFGYSSMVLSFLFIFFGIRSYREIEGNGTISFGRAFVVGLLITLISSVIYVAAWQVMYRTVVPDFMERYADFTIEKMKERGESDEAIAATAVQMEEFGRLYANPLFNVGITFLEVFPVGLVVTLVSAAILRRRGPALEPESVSPSVS